jgi:hypothetical protein
MHSWQRGGADFDRGTGLDGDDNDDDEMMTTTTTMAMTRQ